jgi:type I restriction enzyme M protein
MVAIERDNPRLKGVLPKDYARPGLDKQRLGELIDVIATIELTAASEGENTHRSVDLLGRVYEYFLTRFASAEGKNGGQFYTPSCVVRCLVEMLAPYKGRLYGQECHATTRRDLHPDLRADYVLANPPFDDSDWYRKDDDVRREFGALPELDEMQCHRICS